MHLAVSFLVAANQLTVVAMAAAPPSTFVAGAIQSISQNAVCGAGLDATTSATPGCTSAPTAGAAKSWVAIIAATIANARTSVRTTLFWRPPPPTARSSDCETVLPIR